MLIFPLQLPSSAHKAVQSHDQSPWLNSLLVRFHSHINACLLNSPSSPRLVPTRLSRPAVGRWTWFTFPHDFRLRLSHFRQLYRCISTLYHTLCISTMSQQQLRRRLFVDQVQEPLRPVKKQKRHPHDLKTRVLDQQFQRQTQMSLFGNTKFNTHLSVPSLFGGKSSTKRDVLARNNNRLHGPDDDLDLELSFASTMSLNSPARDSQPLTPEGENPDHVPMDISPAPPRAFQVPQPPVQALNAKPIVGRPRAATSAARLFGRDMSNGYETSSVYSASSVSKSGTGSTAKRLQRSALPTEWFSSAQAQQDENMSSQVSRSSRSMRVSLPFGLRLARQPVDIPSSPVDRMDVDTSFSLASSAPDAHAPPLSAAPTITTFNFSAARASYGAPEPVSAAPTVTTFNNLFYEVGSPAQVESVLAAPADISGVSSISESPCQPFPKKRRSSSPDRKSLSLRRSHQHLFTDEVTSSPAQSSPTVHKLERMASNSLLTNQKRPASLGLGMPPALALNANKKRPRRPALSAMIAPSDAPSAHPQTAYPVMTNQDDGEEGQQQQHRLPPVRRAFSAMLPPNLLDQTMMTASSDASFEQDSSPAQAYARRQQVKTIRRCDGTDDFRPITGATALMKRDTEAIAMGRGLRRSEERENRAAAMAQTVKVGERDTPRSKYLNAGPGLGGFGDNEAHGKILPCHRVREDGLMRINPTTVRTFPFDRICGQVG